MFGDPDAKLTVCGYTDQSIITLCPNDIHLICIECEVTNGVSLLWELSTLEKVSYTADDYVGRDIQQSSFNATLTKKDNRDGYTDYKSQFKASSNKLISILQQNGGSVDVSCVASSSVNDTIYIKVQGKLSFDIEL